MDSNQFKQYVGELGINLSDHQLNQFNLYYQLLTEWNQKMNLTAITDIFEVYEKHFYDSLTPQRFFDFHTIQSMIDVGSGAGFPGIPLKICFPHIHVSILDSLNKRLLFLETVIDELQLEHVNLIHGRAEDMGQADHLRESFDLVIARAVARLSVLSEYCLPFTRVGGTFLVMKGANASVELTEAKKAITLLGGSTDSLHTLSLPNEKSERNVIVIKKEKSTPSKYPRKAGTPSKKPLN